MRSHRMLTLNSTTFILFFLSFLSFTEAAIELKNNFFNIHFLKTKQQKDL